MNEKENVNDETGKQEIIPITFLIPCYNTPLLTSDLLYGALQTKSFDGCAFALLLELSDPAVFVYKELVENVRKKGLNVGYMIYDGTRYCGKVNRASPIINTLTLCVLDNSHLPIAFEKDGKDVVPMKARILEWHNATGPEPMKIGAFDESGSYPVVTKKIVERLGYLYHPLAFGRVEAENWLIRVGETTKLISKIGNCGFIESPSKTLEYDGLSDKEDIAWVTGTLEMTLADTVEHIERHKLR